MEKTVIVGGKSMRMRATARIPRNYRNIFGKDLLSEMNKLQKAYSKSLKSKEETDETEQLYDVDFEFLENVAWLMCKEADEDNVPDSADEWLKGIDGVFSVYEILPQILDLWHLNMKTTSVPRKK